MDSSEKQLNRECSLFCNDGKHVIVGAAILISDDLRPHFYELYTNNEFISTTANCPLEDYTLYIIDLIEGKKYNDFQKFKFYWFLKLIQIQVNPLDSLINARLFLCRTNNRFH